MKRISVCGNAEEVVEVVGVAIVFTFMLSYLRMISFDKLKNVKLYLLGVVHAGSLLCSTRPYFSFKRLESGGWLCVSSVMLENVCKFGELRN
jgi:hypothetical protein